MDFSTPDIPIYKSHISEIIAVVVIIIGALIFMALLNINLNETENKTIQKVVTIEAIESFDNKLTGESLCSSKTIPSEQNSLCNQLTQKNCQVAGCCVWLNGNKCVGGSKDGPTYQTKNGEKINIDYYYYKEKCFGKCPK